MNPEAESLQAKLRLVDDYERKGLLRADEAAAQRTALQKRLLQAVLPDSPAPRVPVRVRLRAIGAMAIVVGGVAAYLLTEYAGMNRRAIEMLEAGKAARASDAAAHQARLERRRAGLPVAPDAAGVFPESAEAAASAPPADVAPLLAGRVELVPGLAGKAGPDDALFIVVRLPEDPSGLPLAAIRKRVADLPLDWRVGERELVGGAARFLQAKTVVVSARVSKSGSGLAQPGDLVGAASAAPWSRDVVVKIDDALPGG